MLRSAVFALAFSAAFGTADWERYESPHCPFAADFPSTTETQIGVRGNADTSVLDGMSYYSVSCGPSPIPLTDRSVGDELVGAMFASTDGGRADSLWTTEVAGTPALRKVHTVGGGLRIHRVALYTDAHIYLLSVSDWEREPADVERFFDGFALLEK